MTSEYQLVVDTWESGGEIDEQVYKDNNISALIIRLNNMNGGHHMDAGFEKQWAEAKEFLRAPYFVYNPWVKGQANFDWLVSHCPDDANTVLVDIEVTFPLYPKSAYAAQVDYFMKLVKDKWGTKTIYTGAWFLDRLDFWPQDADYWWAQYPYALYPEKTTYASWDDIRKIIDDNNFREPFNVEKIPGTYKMWQCSGDRFVCPGNDRIIDINIFPGTYKELSKFLGYPEEVPPPVEPPTEPPAIETLYTMSENFGIYTFTPIESNPPVEEPDIEIVERYLAPKEGMKFVVFSRTPDTQESNKAQYTFWKSDPQPTLKVSLTIPKYRTHMRDDGTTHQVQTWETEKDRLNLQNVWACVPIFVDENKQIVHLSNNNFRDIDFLWDGKDENWALDYVFIPLTQLSETPYIPEEEPPVEEPNGVGFEMKLYVPDTGTYKKVGHDFESEYWHYQPRSSNVNLNNHDDPPTSALPDTAKPKIDRFNAMSKAWQFFWRDLCWYFAPHYSEAEINAKMGEIMSDTTALTDNHAAENGYRNWVTGANPDGKDLAIKELAFGGNILQVLDDNGYEVTAKAFDPSLPPPTVEEAIKSGLIQWTCQSTCYRLDNGDWDGIKNAKPFPSLRDEDGVKIGVPYPLLGLGGRIVFRVSQPPSGSKCNTLSDISNEAEYSPYVKR